jgi:hypothetical protein
LKRLVTFLATLLFPIAALAQFTLTPNVGLEIPAAGSTNWNLPLNYNFNLIDQLFSGVPNAGVGLALRPLISSGPPTVACTTANQGQSDWDIATTPFTQYGCNAMVWSIIGGGSGGGGANCNTAATNTGAVMYNTGSTPAGCSLDLSFITDGAGHVKLTTLQTNEGPAGYDAYSCNTGNIPSAGSPTLPTNFSGPIAPPSCTISLFWQFPSVAPTAPAIEIHAVPTTVGTVSQSATSLLYATTFGSFLGGLTNCGTTHNYWSPFDEQCFPIGASGLNGTVTYTSSQTASSSDNGKLVIMNCSSACAYTLPGTQPSTTWFAWVQTVGSTTATIALGGSDTYNSASSVPVLLNYDILPVWANSATSTDYRGGIPDFASTNMTITPSSNKKSFASTGSGGSGVPGSIQTGNYSANTSGEYIRMNNGSTAVTVTLPASPASGYNIAVQRDPTSTNTVTINPNGVSYDGVTTQLPAGELIYIWTDASGNYHSSVPLVAGSNCTSTPTSTSNTINCSGSGFAGTVTYTSTTTASSSDNNKIVLMNCTSCTYNLPGTQPASPWTISIMAFQSGAATIGLTGGATFNGGSSAPLLNTFRLMRIAANSAVSTDYDGDAPLAAGSGMSFSPTPSAYTLTASGTSSPSVAFNIATGAVATPASAYLNAPSAGTISHCYFTTLTSDGATNLVFNVKLAGTNIISGTNATVTAGASAGAVSTFSLTSGTISVSQGNQWEIDITTGTSSWTGVVQCY